MTKALGAWGMADFVQVREKMASPNTPSGVVAVKRSSFVVVTPSGCVVVTPHGIGVVTHSRIVVGNPSRFVIVTLSGVLSPPPGLVVLTPPVVTAGVVRDENSRHVPKGCAGD